MADEAYITMSSAVITQALATLGSDPVWDRNLMRFLACEALARADDQFGDYSKATEADFAGRHALQAAFGKGYQTDEYGAEVDKLLGKQMAAADERRTRKYLMPYWDAARALARTPAPSLPAALFKVTLSLTEDFAGDNELSEPIMEIVSADFARLQQGAA